ncbi:hypothetical protein IMZ48_11840 [Candidatus Bathyarchaeota archaeon]|nr:hypothetical protein [Candidatus Bathyarchaeota archaeon]
MYDFANPLVDSLISSHVYEIVRTIYSNTSPETDSAHVAVLQQTLSQLRLANIATLDACMNHFTRLIDLTSAPETYVTALASALAPCILRPKIETSLTLEEKHAYRLVRDLFAHKDGIFNELKRMSTPGYSGSLGRSATRPRAISTDESNRKANMEERNRLLVEKSHAGNRASSPVPSPRGHRRDRSVGGPDTRFPIASPAAHNDRHRSSLGSAASNNTSNNRQSLEVPGGEGASTPVPAVEPNGDAAVDLDSPRQSISSQSPVEKRNSLGRSGARFSGGRRLPVNLKDSPRESPRQSMSGAARGVTLEDRGVTLEDKPMED